MASPTDKDPEVVAPGSLEARTAMELGRNPEASLPSTALDPRKTAAYEAERVTMEFDDVYRVLPPSRQAMMHLGFHQPHEDFEMTETLGGKRLVAVTSSGNNTDALTTEIVESGFALPLGTAVISGPDSSSRTRFFIVPSTENLYATVKLSEEKGLPAQFKVSGHTKGVIRIGTHVIPLDPLLLANTDQRDVDQTFLELSNPDPQQTKKISPSGLRTSQVPSIIGKPNFPSQRLRDLQLQVAQKPDGLEDNFVEECTFLVLDINAFLKNPLNRSPQTQRILAKLAGLAVSPDFFITLDQKGHLLIINRSQRSGSKLALMASEINQIKGVETNILLGKGTFRNRDGNVSMENYPDSGSLAVWERRGIANPGVYLTPATFEALGGRDSTTVKLTARKITRDGSLIILESVQRAARLHISGPEKFIGNETELERAKKSLHPVGGAKLVIINGAAGSGKSRLANEVLKDHPNAIVHSVDASGENIPGSALADLAITIANSLNTRLDNDQKSRFATEINNLKNFNERLEEERIKVATKSPNSLVQYCLLALSILEKCGGSFVLTIDDMHHIDRHSEAHITGLIEKFLTESKSKVLIMRRPEEIYHSVAQNNLAANVRLKCRKDSDTNPVETIDLHDEAGKPKLNLQDPQIAYDYAFYSLPADLRTNPTISEDRKLGTWPQELAGKCRTPFDFTSLINSLLENPEKSFVVSLDQLSLKSATMNKILAIPKEGDLLSYHQNRMRRLSAPARGILQCVAILGSKVSYQNLMAIAHDILGIEGDATTVISELAKGGYIVTHEDGGFAIQHDNYKNVVMSTLNEKEKRELILKIYAKFEADPQIHNDKKFALLAEISDEIKITDQNRNFWAHYLRRSNEAMHDAEKDRAHGRGYSVAMTILGNLKDSHTPLGNALSSLEKGGDAAKDIPGGIKKMLTAALFSIVQNGLPLGRLEKVIQAIAILEKIGADEVLTQAYVIGFRTAQMQTKIPEMQAYYNKALKRQDLKPGDSLSMEIRLAFKQEEFKKLKNLFIDNSEYLDDLRSSDVKTYTDIMRLKQRIMVDFKRRQLEKEGVDGDVVFEPGWLKPEETANFLCIKKELGQLDAARQKDPDSFDLLQELNLLDQLAEVEAFLGNYDIATQYFSEVCRIARQMEIPTEAARVSKTGGDIEIMKGIASIKYPTEGEQGQAKAIPGDTILRKHIVKGIQTYTENGMKAVEDLSDDNIYQLLMRAQRMRGISILVASYQNEIDAVKSGKEAPATPQGIKEALTPYLKHAIDDFNYINNNPRWNTIFTGPSRELYSYYVTSSMGNILGCIKDLDLTADQLDTEIPGIFDARTYPAFNPDCLQDGLGFGRKAKDHLGEALTRKLPGLEKLIDQFPTGPGRAV
ncbi:AAA family ATPase [Candidatus Peregrinibacteria bacterium]|nr:AAA family ATPase [Candidatus Peregrinibacteria bacterium]